MSTESGDDYSATAVLLTPGARYRRLNVPGEDDLIGAGVHFCATCDGPFYKGEQVVVVGGGNSGVEEGLFLTRFAREGHPSGTWRRTASQPHPPREG